MTRSSTHLVIIPSYNTGPKLVDTVLEALSTWRPIWVVVDGSTDGSDHLLASIRAPEKDLRVLHLSENCGKGAAVLEGLRVAAETGFSHSLVMDADGQHPSEKIGLFMSLAKANPDAMVLGVPFFGPEAPSTRRYGRRVGNWWTNLETLWGGIGDSLFGFRVYPVKQTLAVFRRSSGGRRYDFDTIAVVRLFWAGVPPINVQVPVRYFSAADGGVSHFHFGRDNLLLVARHTRLVAELLIQLPSVWRCRRRARAYLARIPQIDTSYQETNPAFML